MSDAARGLAALDRLPAEEAAAVLLPCCGSRAWAARMAAGRPYPLPEALYAAAEEAWWRLDEADWRQAFAAHPRIGERRSGDGRHESWSRHEQAGAASLAAGAAAELAAANRRYEERFGHVFLISASGRSGEQMLAILHRRLDNDPAHELRVAAAEQRRITRLRLERLLAELAGEET